MSNLSNVSLSLSGIPCEVVARNVVLFNYNVSTVISFARTGKDYYKEITEYVDKLWLQRVKSSSSQSSQMTFFEFIGGCRRLFIDYEYVNRLLKLEKNKGLLNSEFDLQLADQFVNSLVRNLTYQKYEETGGAFMIYDLPDTLKSDLKLVKVTEAKIAHKQWTNKIACGAFIIWLFIMIGAIVFSYYFYNPSRPLSKPASFVF